MRRLTEKTSVDILKGRKNKWITLSKSDIKDISSEIFDWISIAYAPIGGHLKYSSPNDVESIQFAEIVDLDTDPEADLILFGKETRYGIKMIGVGHDGEKLSKRTYIQKSVDSLKKGGGYTYAEVSDKIADIFISKGVQVISDEATIRKVLGKDIEYHGELKGKQGYGWYSRKIAGKKKAKILIGNVAL